MALVGFIIFLLRLFAGDNVFGIIGLKIVPVVCVLIVKQVVNKIASEYIFLNREHMLEDSQTLHKFECDEMIQMKNEIPLTPDKSILTIYKSFFLWYYFLLNFATRLLRINFILRILIILCFGLLYKFFLIRL